MPTLQSPLPVRDARWFQCVADRIGGDIEMALIGRHLNATVSFTFGDQRHDMVLREGKAVETRHGRKIDWRSDVGFRAPDAVWDKFFDTPAPPLYNSIFAMIMRVDEFRVEGDTLVLAQNARALTRVFDILQSEGQAR